VSHLFKQPPFQFDAFGRQRISEPFTLGDYKHLYGIDPNFLDVVANNGTATYDKNKACVTLATSNAANSYVIHQTKMYHHYMPGKSQFILSSFCFGSNTTNVTKRTGYFDDHNGIYFEQAGNNQLTWAIRSNVTNTAIDSRVSQSYWNVDKCDGTGPSGFVLDTTKTQLATIDFEWLGVGSARVGFVSNGTFVTAHRFDNANYSNTVYMSTPNLPVRCEILNVGATTGGSMDQICSTVMSEGGYVESGIDWAFTSNTRIVTTANSLPVMAIRLSNTFKGYENRIIVRLGNINVFTDTDNIKYDVIKISNPAFLTGGTWVAVNANSGVEYNVTAIGYSDGDQLDGGFVTAAAGQGQSGKNIAGAPTPNIPSSAKKNFIVQNFDSSNSEIFVVAARGIGTASSNTAVNIQWREIF
jgi:hypothetical protein